MDRMGKEATHVGVEMSGCNERVFDYEHAAENESIWNTYGSELAGDFGTKACGEPVVRDGKCEKHKVERRKSLVSERRRSGSTDTPVPCGNKLCRWEHGQVNHDLMCPDRGPGWA